MQFFRARKRSLIGLTGPNAAAGSKFGAEDWSLGIRLVAVKDPEAGVTERNVHCRTAVSHEDLKKHMRWLKPYQVIEVEIEDDSNPNRIIISNVRKAGLNEKPLLEIAERLQEAVVIHDDDLGELVLDRRFGCYVGNVEWQGQTIKIRLESTNAEEPAEAVRRAQALLDSEDEWSTKIGEFAIDKMLDMKNGEWRDDDETEISGPEFLSRMVPTALDLTDEGDFTFWFDDGDLFFGHTIMIDGNLETGLRNAGIAG